MDKTVSHYEILGKLGEGGMGVVYQARDMRLGRIVALKFLPRSLSESETGVARFEDEARAISILNHPNIATIYELDSDGEDRFLALEYLPNGTLRGLLAQHRAVGRLLPYEKLLEYAWQIAEGLAHAHAHGIIHRDVKTDNVMLTASGTLKITDFGLAKLRDSTSRTITGHVAGTAACMSPEQAWGKPVDHRSDIFSFGILLYEMATLELPFQGQSALEVMQQIYSQPAPPVSATRSDLPAEFQHIIDKALAKEREDRYQSMDEVLRDLQAAGAGRISVRLTGPTPQESPTLTAITPLAVTRRRKGRTRRVLLWAGAVVPAAAVVSGGLLWFREARLSSDRHIAVLPFANIGGDRETQALCDGLVESLTGNLSQLQRFQDSLWVVPSSEVRAQPVANAAAARQVFGARLVVTGSLQNNAGQLRLITNLIDTGDRHQIASRTIDASLENITELQDTVAERVAEMLDLDLNPAMRRALAAGRTTVPAAYEAYTRGRGLAQTRKPEDYALAAGLFELATRQDPTYALAWAELGHADLGRYLATRDQQFLDQARAACRHAIELNADLPAVHLAMGELHAQTGQPEEAVAEFQRVLALDSANFEAYFRLAQGYEALGRLADAEATYQKSIRLRGEYWAGYNGLGRFYSQHGQYDKAEQNFRMVTTLAPDNVLGYNNLGGLYNKMGRYPEAVAALEKSIALQPSGAGYSNLGTILYFLERYDDAVPMMRKAVELLPNYYVVWGNLGDACRWSTRFRGQARDAYLEAIRRCEKNLRVRPDDSLLLASLALYHAKIGEMAPALAGIANALRQTPLDRGVHFKAGIAYELAGQRTRALEELEAALRAGYSSEEITRERELAALRQDSRFQRVLEAAVPKPGTKP